MEPPEAAPTRTEGKRVIVVMPAYNAAKTLERTYADIPEGLVDHVILVDDVSKDETVDVARQLGLDVRIHRQNLGYGGNQKTCYDAALAAGADVVVMPLSFWAIPSTRYRPRPTPPKIAPSVAVATICVAAARIPPEMTGTATGTSTRARTWRS